MEKIKTGQVPNYAFMSYDPKGLDIISLSILPKHFITMGIIQKRNPLSVHARRKGWIGSNILLKQLPSDAMLYMVRDREAIDQDIVRGSWNRYVFLRGIDLKDRGWTIDVLNCVQDLEKKEFTLKEMYEYTDKLASLHPRNQHVQPKIRQQLQVLRDHGIPEDVKRGVYRMI